MKFVCEKCKTKYSIADEKVRGKVLKIRCKNCANIIVVREAAQPAARKAAAAGGGGGGVVARAPKPSMRKSSLDDAFDGAFSAAPAPAPLPSPAASRKRKASRRLSPAPPPPEIEDDSTHLSAAPDLGFPGSSFEPEATRLAPPPQPDSEPEDEWFLAVDGNQYGPMTFAELCSRVKRGEARSESGEEAYCWRDGFDDWVEVTSVPELRPYAPPPPPPSARSRSGLFPVGPGGPGLPPPPGSNEPSQQAMLPPMPAVPSLPPGARPGSPHAGSPHAGGGPLDSRRPDSGLAPRQRLDSTGGGFGAPPITPSPAVAPAVPPPMSAAAPPPLAPAVAPPAPAPAATAAPEIAAAMESGLRVLPQSYSEAPVGPAAAVAMQPMAPASSKTPLSIKIAAVGGIVSTLTGLAILIYFLAFDRQGKPDTPKTGSSQVATKTVGEQPKQAKIAPKPDAAAVASAFPPMEVGRTTERGVHSTRTGVRRTRPKRKGKKLSAEEKRLLALYGNTGSGAALPSGLVKRRSHSSGRKLKASDVQAVHRRNARGLKVCYERAAKRDNTLKNVRVDVTLAIAGSGKVRRVSLTFSGGKSPDLKACLQRNLIRWVFHGASAQNIAFPLIFRGT
ncbi:MAG: zinc-ribbon domain-containing protein [Myxococcales bacterium]|nr:zinc-ribbon domain-containing protein [Myxococcales bacterium]